MRAYQQPNAHPRITHSVYSLKQRNTESIGIFMVYNALIICYEDHGGIAYDLTVTKGYSKDGSAQLKSFVDLLKSQVPASNRVYDPQTKVWTIEKQIFENHLLKLMDMLKIRYFLGLPRKFDYYGTPVTPKIDPNNFFYNTVPVPQAQTRESITESLAKILEVPTATLAQPLDVVKKIYRRKALELHPDRNNGDGSKMSELNSLWSVFSA